MKEAWGIAMGMTTLVSCSMPSERKEEQRKSSVGIASAKGLLEAQLLIRAIVD